MRSIRSYLQDKIRAAILAKREAEREEARATSAQRKAESLDAPFPLVGYTGGHPVGAHLYDYSGGLVEIVKGYGAHRVQNGRGGTDWRLGYAGRDVETGAISFYLAHELHDEDGYETHLNLAE